MEFEGYALWLVPEGRLHDRLRRMISSLAKKYNSPVFEPHLSLSSLLKGREKDLEKKNMALASSVKPFEITLTTAGHLGEYFRCVFFRAEGEGLCDANARYRKIFGRQEDAFMPHLSLMYGNFPPEVREEISGKIGRLGESFHARSVHLYGIGSAEPKDWKRIREFS